MPEPQTPEPLTPAPARSAADPTRESLWRPLRLLQASMDADIERIYTEQRIDGLKPSYVMELLRLNAHGPMTIAELADSVGRTHSALSQKVAAMRSAGWVQTVVGADARTRKVTLTDRARRVVDRLAAEWQATEAALAELEAEIPYPLSRVVTDIGQALERRSFHDRIAEKLALNAATDPSPPPKTNPGPE
ncbi:MarR family winged helix-turn-helix transcriptional regulator [Streptomyces sp. NPDC090306]|uniref:MarR family winged helix-turn-helix transcriptional regulator n=1 Tax=Streptomyces sp. NPDC090306 TaxID=3365961 RepID=UPI003805CB4F